MLETERGEKNEGKYDIIFKGRKGGVERNQGVEVVVVATRNHTSVHYERDQIKRTLETFRKGQYLHQPADKVTHGIVV